MEHQLGAAIILAMVWLGRREPQLPIEQRPLGKKLPAIAVGLFMAFFYREVV